MILVPIINQQFNQILDNFKDEILRQDESVFEFEKFKFGEIDRHYACTIEHLNEVRNESNMGRTCDIWSTSLDKTSLNHLVVKLNEDLAEWDKHKGYIVPRKGLVSLRKELFHLNALSAVYPPNGFMGWHNNSDCPGDVVLLTWTKNGNGFFRYEDPQTKEIVTLNDTPGWSCKLGHFGSLYEPDKVFWHCCSTEELRITVAWVFPTLQASNEFQDRIQQL